jgi:hypothetical protein
MGGFVSLSGSSAKSKQNFYGFKYDPSTDSLTIEEYLWGDNSAQIYVPQINDDGTVYARYDDTYYTTALTPYEFSFRGILHTQTSSSWRLTSGCPNF